MTITAYNPSKATRLVEDVGDWIDQYNIAHLILEAIHDELDIKPTVDQCQQVWYRVLYELPDLISQCARHLDVDYD